MSKGHARHQERHHGLSQFGKDLVRRCGSKCELCDSHGVKLVVYEVPPIEPEPNYDHCIMICETCQGQLDRPKTIDPAYWRFLATSMWSSVAPVKVISVALLRHLAKQQDWADALLEQVYMEEDERAWSEDIDLF
ncbi:phnA protein [Amphritea pacifica]|uniref:PhnA protein n=1 Tax=Amphritea pacifica TaxID=2811233 RepID=A0ABS2W8W6_9GAMM|nr:phnA protein [Amphritea pacifica]MBN0988018.1 phnA protein [Amphritea pacifica]MBN1005666.1 phnA protein [Amphritea pacifica]